MATSRVHTLYRRGSWLVEVENWGVLSRHELQAEAVASGQRTADEREADHLIHAEDGLVIEERRHTAPAVPAALPGSL